LDQDRRVIMCRYADLVSQPDDTMRRIYGFVDLPYPGSHLVGGVYEDSRGLGRSVPLNPDIEALCETMWNRLNAADASIDEVAMSSISA
jgi:hypothetical protein